MDNGNEQKTRFFQSVSFYDYLIIAISVICFSLVSWFISTIVNTLDKSEQMPFLVQVFSFLLLTEFVVYTLARQKFFQDLNPIIHRAIGAIGGICVLVQLYIIYYAFVLFT